MKKMTKALALLTVMAMLATMFVAAPASAAIPANQQPTVNVHFTSGNTPDSAAVDPSAVAVGTVFYVWVDIANFAPDSYVMSHYTFLSYDTTVETPYNLSAKKAATTAATAKRGFVWADLEQYSEDDMSGFYQATTAADLTNGSVSAWLIVHSDLQGVINAGDYQTMEDYTEGTFLQIPAGGAYTAFGWAFIKTAEGPSGITIADGDPNSTKTLNGKPVFVPAHQEPDATTVLLVDMPTTYREVDGAAMAGYTYAAAGDTDAGRFNDLSPRDSEATEAPTDAPATDEPAPTDVPVSGEVTGAKQASKSNLSYNMNAFFYEFTTPVIPGEVTGLTATFQIPGKDVAEGRVINIDFTGMSNVALKIAAVVKNIPAGQEDTPVTTNYALSYTDPVTSAAKVLEWTRTDSLN